MLKQKEVTSYTDAANLISTVNLHKSLQNFHFVLYCSERWKKSIFFLFLFALRRVFSDNSMATYQNISIIILIAGKK